MLFGVNDGYKKFTHHFSCVDYDANNEDMQIIKKYNVSFYILTVCPIDCDIALALINILLFRPGYLVFV